MGIGKVKSPLAPAKSISPRYEEKRRKRETLQNGLQIAVDDEAEEEEEYDDDEEDDEVDHDEVGSVSMSIASGRSNRSPNAAARYSKGGVIGDLVYMPNSPVVTLDGLLKEAEEEVVQELSVRGSVAGSSRSRSASPVKREPVSVSALAQAQSQARIADPIPQGGEQARDWDGEERPWTKSEWKILDACFSDVRFDLGGEEADVDEVPLEKVVEIFVGRVGEFWDRWVFLFVSLYFSNLLP
jgi:hypothetical protein